MNVDFKVLWFEDTPEWYEPVNARVSDIISEYSLKPIFNWKTGKDFDLKELLQTNDYDLILMDFKLAGIYGDEIIESIRNYEVLTDILFYSSQFEEMLTSIREKTIEGKNPIDGVYYVDRENESFIPKVEKLINKIIRRTEDVVYLRGFVLDQTSEIENRIKEILNALWQKIKEEDKKVLLDEAIKCIEDARKFKERTCNDALEKECVYTFAVNDDHLLGAVGKLKLFTKQLNLLIEKYKLENKDIYKCFNKKYENEVSAYRNKLGHITCKDFSIRVHGEVIQIDEKLQKLMRSRLSDYLNVINDIEQHISMLV